MFIFLIVMYNELLKIPVEDWVVLAPNKFVPAEFEPNKLPCAGVVEPKFGVPNVPAAGVLFPNKPYAKLKSHFLKHESK